MCQYKRRLWYQPPGERVQTRPVSPGVFVNVHLTCTSNTACFAKEACCAPRLSMLTASLPNQARDEERRVSEGRRGGYKLRGREKKAGNIRAPNTSTSPKARQDGITHLASSNPRRASESSSAYFDLPLPPFETYRKLTACLRLLSTASQPLPAPPPATPAATSPSARSPFMLRAFSCAIDFADCCCGEAAPVALAARPPAGGPRARSLRSSAWPSLSRIAPRLARTLSSASRRMSLV